MRRFVIAGNWKMHGSNAMITELLPPLCAGARSMTNIDWIVFPPFLYIPQIAQALVNSNIAWGGQNIYIESQGAFTGEVSGLMLKELGCKYVLVGHSERRSLFGETNAIVAKKFIAAQAAGLIPVLCVGETLAEREQNKTEQVVSDQLKAVLDLPEGVKLLEKAIIAYEPVWAIGTGVTATPEQAQEVHAFLRQQIAKKDGKIASQVTILYGGSVKASNAEQLFAMPDIDGGLVGGASLNADEFLAIGKAACQVQG